MRIVCRLSGRLSTASATLALFLLSVVGLAGQEQSTATLSVRVTVDRPARDGAVVHVQSVDDPRLTRSVSAEPMRPTIIRALVPGTYRVVVSGAGDASGTMDVRLDAGEVVSLAVTLAAAGGASGIRVADRSHAGDAVVMGTTQLDGMPSDSHLWSLLDALVPWTLVDVIDNGGIGTGRRGLFGVRDASWTWNSFVMDGLDVTDPDRPGTPLQYPDIKAMQAIAVTSNLAPAEVSAPGAQVTLVPRRPGPTRQGSLEFAGTADRMVARRGLTDPPPIARLKSLGDSNAQFGGPLDARAGLFLAGRVTRSEFMDRNRPTPRTSDVGSLFTHFVARPTEHDEIRSVFSTQDITRPLEGGDAFLGRAVDEQSTFRQFDLRWDRVTARGTTASVAVGFQQGVFAPDIGPLAAGGAIDRVFDGAVPAPVSRRRSSQVEVRARIGLRAVPIARGWHAVRFDVAIKDADARSHILTAPDVAELVAGVPARVWQWVVPGTDSVRGASEASGVLADQIRWGRHLTVDASVRVDRWHGRAEDALRGIDTTTLAPRVSWRTTVADGLAVFGAYGRLHPQPALAWLAFGDPGQPWARLYRWTDPNADGAFEPGELGAPIGRAGWGAPLGSIDRLLRIPTTSEYVIGAEYRHGTATLRATATIRREHSLVRAVNVGLPLSSYTQTLISDQTDNQLLIPVYGRPPDTADQDAYLLTNPDADVLHHQGLEIHYEQAVTPRLRMGASALEWWTFGPGGAPGFRVTENDQGVVGELFQDPNTATHAGGANFFDRSYVLKWSGTYQAPRDVWCSFTANYRDGQPFAGLIVVPDLPQGPEIVQSYRRGRTRFTFTVLLDARVEKRLKIFGSQAAVWLDMFNLANMSNEVEENPVTGPLSRQTTALQPPRTLRAGFRITF